MRRPSVEQARKQFERETTEHEITVLHDDGVYRHMRLAKPGTGMWSWNLITWPGHLAVAGDIGDGWSFSREHDMFGFFRSNGHEAGINPDYWWEKMPSQLRDAGRHYSEDVLRQLAHEHIEEWPVEPHDHARATAEFDDSWEDALPVPEEQQRVIRDFSFIDEHGIRHDFGPDTWEWGAEDYDHHFLLALFAIVYGIRKYDEHRAETAAEAVTSDGA